PLGGMEWRDPSVATGHVHTFDFDPGAFFKTTLTAQQLSEPTKLSQLTESLSAFRAKELLATDGSSPLPGLKPQVTAGVLVVDAAGTPHFFMVYSAETVVRFTPVISPPSSVKSRAPL